MKQNPGCPRLLKIVTGMRQTFVHCNVQKRVNCMVVSILNSVHDDLTKAETASIGNRNVKQYFENLKRAVYGYSAANASRRDILEKMIKNDILSEVLQTLQQAANQVLAVALQDGYKDLNVASCFALPQWRDYRQNGLFDGPHQFQWGLGSGMRRERGKSTISRICVRH